MNFYQYCRLAELRALLLDSFRDGSSKLPHITLSSILTYALDHVDFDSLRSSYVKK